MQLRNLAPTTQLSYVTTVEFSKFYRPAWLSIRTQGISYRIWNGFCAFPLFAPGLMFLAKGNGILMLRHSRVGNGALLRSGVEVTCGVLSKLHQTHRIACGIRYNCSLADGGPISPSLCSIRIKFLNMRLIIVPLRRRNRQCLRAPQNLTAGPCGFTDGGL